VNNFFWKAWAVVLVLSIFWLGWCLKTSAPAAAQSGDVPDVIRAKSFEVVDAEGQTRAKLVAIADGSPALGLMDANGGTRALLCLHPDGSPRLIFADDRGTARAVFLSEMVELHDADGKPRATLYLSSDGSPEVILRSADWKVLFSAP